MTNEVATGAGRAVAMTAAERAARVRERVAALTAAGGGYKPFEGGVQFLRVDGNTGEMTYGRDNTEIPMGQQFAIALDSCSHGIHFWESKSKKDEIMIPCIAGPMPTVPAGHPKGTHRKGDLPKPRERDGWSDIITIRMVGVGGEMNRVELSFDANNSTKMQRASDLIAQMTQMVDTPWGEEGFFNALITLGIDSYRDKNYDKDVYFPTFEIVGWTDFEGNVRLIEKDSALTARKTNAPDGALNSLLD